MKWYFLTLAAIGAATAGSVQAQSQITVFGVVDAHLRHVDNGAASATQVGSGGESSSRFGLRGSEDLGQGLAASFWLESGVSADTGISTVTNLGSTRFWHRRSTLSLSGPWGELRAGRDTLPTWTALSSFEVFGAVGVGNATNLYSDNGVFGSRNRVRGDNVLAYFLPSGKTGVYGHFAVAPDEDVVGGGYRGGRLGYRGNAWELTGAYGQTRVAQDRLKTLVGSGSYTVSGVKLAATVQKTEFAGGGHRYYYLAASKPVGAGVFKLSHTWLRGDGSPGGVRWEGRAARQLALGYVHNLSKQTALFGTVSWLHNNAQTGFTVGSISGASAANGAASRGLDLGVRHRF